MYLYSCNCLTVSIATDMNRLFRLFKCHNPIGKDSWSSGQSRWSKSTTISVGNAIDSSWSWKNNPKSKCIWWYISTVESNYTRTTVSFTLITANLTSFDLIYPHLIFILWFRQLLSGSLISPENQKSVTSTTRGIEKIRSRRQIKSKTLRTCGIRRKCGLKVSFKKRSY